ARQDPKQYWWQNRSFSLDTLVENDETPSNLQISPGGQKLAYVLGRGDLWTMELDGGANRRILAGWNPPELDWSPDGKWRVYAALDNDFNKDVFVMPADGSRKPFNLSRHPFTEGAPVWS